MTNSHLRYYSDIFPLVGLVGKGPLPRLTVFSVAALIMFGCVTPDTFRRGGGLEGGQRPLSDSYNDGDDSHFRDDSTEVELTASIMRQITIKLDEGLSGRRDAATTAVKSIVEFLGDRFGGTVFRGKVEIVIERGGRHSTIFFQDYSGEFREVRLSTVTLLPTEWHIIAHELFHALYQDETLLRNSPVFAIEGLATYAEWLWRFGRGKDYDVATKGADIYNSTICDGDVFRGIDHFEELGDCTGKAYALGGLWIAGQDSAVRRLVRRIVSHPPRKKLTVNSWTRKYRLRTVHQVLSKHQRMENSDPIGSPPIPISE